MAMGMLAAGCKPPKPAKRGPPTTQSAAAIAQPTRFEYSKIYMGMKTRLVVYASDETHAVNACRAALRAIGRVDDVASDYRKDSELMRLCGTAATRPVALSDDLFILLTEAQKLARLSDGDFDMTVGPYVQLWRQARKRKRFPPPRPLPPRGNWSAGRRCRLIQSIEPREWRWRG